MDQGTRIAAEGSSPAKAAKAAAVRAPGRVHAVVGGHNVNRPPGYRDGGTLQPLVGGQDVDLPGGYRQGLIGVEGVVAGGNGVDAAGDGHVAVGVDCVVRAVQREGPAVEGQGGSRLEALGADAVGGLHAAAAAGDGGTAALRYGQRRLRLNAVLPGGQVQEGVGDTDPAQRAVGVIGGADGIPAAGHGDGGAVDGVGILAVDAIVHRLDGEHAVINLQGVLAGDAVAAVGRDGQRPRPLSVYTRST